MLCTFVDLYSHFKCRLCYSITEYCKRQDLDPGECVQLMRQRVFDETKLTVSAGIAPNKVRLEPLCLTNCLNLAPPFSRCWLR